MQIQTSKLIAFVVLFLTLQSSFCFLNQLSDSDIRTAIKSAVEDGLVAVDSFLRKQYWQYLQGSQMELYNVTILTHSLSYKIIYSLRNNIYRGNCHIDKLTWEPYLNSLVKLPTELADKLHEKNPDDLFLLKNGVREIQPQPILPEDESQKQAVSSGQTTLENLTPIPREPQQSPQSSGTVILEKTSLKTELSN